MAGPRDYTEATKKALFALSLGRCYAPDCPRPVTEMDGEVPVITVQIAHIRAARRDGPRYDPTMTDDERRAFKNLILLCSSHHPRVDGKETGPKYATEDLEAWKAGPEHGISDDLSALTDGDLTEALTVSVRTMLSEVKAELLQEITKLEEVTGESARLLRVLVRETLTRPELDAELVASLADSSNALGHLSDTVPMLEATSIRLQHLPDSAELLLHVARQLQSLQDSAGLLHSVARDFRSLPDHAGLLLSVARDFRSLPDHAELLLSVAEEFRSLPHHAERIHGGVDELRNGIREFNVAAAEMRRAAEDVSGQVVDPDDEGIEPDPSAYDTSSHPPDRMTWFLRGVYAAVGVGALVGIIIALLVSRS